MNKKVEIQQGDCILVEDTIPENAKPIKTGKSHILLRGEGVNTHVIEGDFDLYELNGTLYMSVRTGKLVHEEHGVVTVPKKTYRRVIEREYDYEEREARNVED